MKISPVEKLFTLFNETAIVLQEELFSTYLDALAETGENIFEGAILQDGLSELALKRLEKKYSEIQLDGYTNEEIRKAFQLVILKGMKESAQPNHQMTPDSVGILIGYLVQKFMKDGVKSILDPAVGTGNLLTAVLNNQLTQETSAIGIDVDDLLIKLAYVNANLQRHPVQFFNQDSLEPLLVDPVDVVVSDLPVGYYPNDLRAQDYVLKAAEGHSYAHHLLIEQSVKHVKPGGYLFFIVPNGLFESEEAPRLREFLKEKVIIQGFMQLPLNMFNNKQSAKSILILQKKGENVEPPKEVLLVSLPSLSSAQAMEKILTQIQSWISENK
ncbi:class I SAM-dependent methyltransferase [Bacillus sp. CGMCC 1.16607]|uniref:class I SAM-dependent methyltransferase n=1 Tax=Bacillus sp. CGMCC 1.16607 TaxID=3351842 RepID=UPI00363CC256